MIDSGQAQNNNVLIDAATATGAERMAFLKDFEHPITCETIQYSAEPLPVQWPAQD